jgi:hypothetical protein
MGHHPEAGWGWDERKRKIKRQMITIKSGTEQLFWVCRVRPGDTQNQRQNTHIYSLAGEG